MTSYSKCSERWKVHSFRFCLRHEPNSGASCVKGTAAALANCSRADPVECSRAVPELIPCWVTKVLGNCGCGLFQSWARVCTEELDSWSCGLFHSWFWIRAKLGSCKGGLFQRPFWVRCELDSCIYGLFEPIVSPLWVTQEFGSCTCEHFAPIIRVVREGPVDGEEASRVLSGWLTGLFQSLSRVCSDELLASLSVSHPALESLREGPVGREERLPGFCQEDDFLPFSDS